jgi:predicted mannosyl-3-phosphoglycerate phosphatase (HAD superfamily)
MCEIVLNDIKTKIESMNKIHQIEILKVLNKNPLIKLNENKSGVYVNLSFLPQDSIEEIQQAITYILEQETALQNLELQKNEFKSTFFIEKDNKEETILYSRNT